MPSAIKPARLPVGPTIQIVLGAVILFWSGFFTTDFFISGVFTWPRTSRILTLTLAACIFSFEFVYKEQHLKNGPARRAQTGKVVFYACMLPYMLGSMALLLLWAVA